MAKSKKYVETPLMKQYYAIKDQHPDAVLLFRVGDFYETFGEDAIKAAEILGITLTKRANGAASFVELAGFPHHALDTYLPKLVRAGQRVAICEQLEDPKMTKKIVKRGITELVTPGVSINDNILEHRENNFLASVHFDKKMAGVAFLDISTGEFLTAEGSFEYIDKLLNSFKPKEVLFQRGKGNDFIALFGGKFYTYTMEDWVYTEDAAVDRLLRHFETKSLKGFGVQELKYGVLAAGAILHYLDLTQHHHIQHITSLSRIEEDKYVWLDRFTIRNLELFGAINEGAKTLSQVLDKTISPMGSRMLKRWIALPLKEIAAINDRLSVVEYFTKKQTEKEELSEQIRQIGDLERIISKVAVGRINPREVVQLRHALRAIEPIKNYTTGVAQEVINRMGEQLNPCNSIRERMEREITNDPPVLINRGNVIQQGVSEELDELRKIAYSGKDYLAQMQERESKRTGIPSLKIAFNNVFGYYIEVRNTHKDKVPEDWVRKQTLVSAERYITEELKEYESKILGAEEKILALEARLFNELVVALSEYIQSIQLNAVVIARLDCLLSFATSALEFGYNKPEINASTKIEIKDGRHPVIEQQLPIGEEYISNDVLLNQDDQQIIIITGPNMAGKSALLRQTALIVLMAQMGSFVPARKAGIGYVDKIFTRVGASDNISLGESTFMVEMNEAASILNNLSDRSLILLDELGRGTSTYDGISIAWSIVEYIHEQPKAKAKTLFATHYHELNEMEKSFGRVKNFNVTVKEVGNKVIFLRKLVRGGSNHSFGIHVAKMAGMPPSVVKRADEILAQLEEANRKDGLAKPLDGMAEHREGFQMSFFQLDDPVLKQIRDEIKHLDIDNLTPIEALNKLNGIKKLSGLK
ncbi:DNA mismatch repair protein MutS [Sunxiuqinia elliptica]|uniref:DNA mismatch repair protein MutS n=1 Tax=Sunxiuqinia elliptica TaxID=655355 RepID=A0A1I2F162_9BACT|nr:DNA mismatch repair protein MutS [Sunxiuqinia elliptica]SFE98396.1 DNA mismatch repair protein MutS [Sunxiuqinia elliptica]